MKKLLKTTFKSIHANYIKHFSYLADIFNFNSIEQLTNKLRLLYRASEHNFECSKFHQLCDGKGKTLVLIRSKSKNLFGGYSTISWHSNSAYSSAPGSFLFSLDKQTKHTIYQNEGKAIYGNSSRGPDFGGTDLYLYNKCHSNNSGSYSNLGNTYCLPPSISYNTNESQSYLAGSYQFEVEEYEVFLVD